MSPRNPDRPWNVFFEPHDGLPSPMFRSSCAVLRPGKRAVRRLAIATGLITGAP